MPRACAGAFLQLVLIESADARGHAGAAMGSAGGVQRAARSTIAARAARWCERNIDAGA